MATKFKIERVVLSDYAVVEQGTTKVTLAGCFNQLVARAFPAALNFFATLTVSGFSVGEHTLVFSFSIRPEGSEETFYNLRANLKLEIGQPTTTPSFTADKIAIDFPIQLPSVQIPKPGSYALTVKGENLDTFQRIFNVDGASTPEKGGK